MNGRHLRRKDRRSWATLLVAGVSHWMVFERCLLHTRIPEGAVQLVTAKLLARQWGTELWEKFDITNAVDPGRKKKQADFALITAGSPRMIIEVKTASDYAEEAGPRSGATLQIAPVIQDLGRLLLCAHHLEVPAFLFFCGTNASLREGWPGTLSKFLRSPLRSSRPGPRGGVGQLKEPNRSAKKVVLSEFISTLRSGRADAADRYAARIGALGVSKFFTRICNFRKTGDGISACLWQISACEDRLLKEDEIRGLTKA